MSAAIETRGLGKRYRLGVDAAAYDTLRDAITRAIRPRRPQDRTIWALRDLDLDIEAGEAVLDYSFKHELPNFTPPPPPSQGKFDGRN